MGVTTYAGSLLIPTEGLPGEWCTPTIETEIELWALASGIEQRQLRPTCNERVGSARLEKIPRMEEQFVQFGFGLLITRGPFNQLCDVPGDRGAAEPAA